MTLATATRATKVRGRLKRAQSERTYDLPVHLHNNNYRPLLENDSRYVETDEQGDQIGRIFAFWATDHFGQFCTEAGQYLVKIETLWLVLLAA
jgi:hypothetical protein